MKVVKKIALFIFFTFVVSYVMLCLEYFSYSMAQTKLKDLVNALGLFIMGLIYDVLNKYNLFGKFTVIVDGAIILLSVAISLRVLKYILFVWQLK